VCRITSARKLINPLKTKFIIIIYIYIKAKRDDFLCTFVCVLLGDGCYAPGGFSFWSVLGLFLIGNDNNGVVFSLVLLGDGGVLLCSGGVFLLVSSRYVFW
jgi:hypothetical protein